MIDKQEVCGLPECNFTSTKVCNIKHVPAEECTNLLSTEEDFIDDEQGDVDLPDNGQQTTAATLTSLESVPLFSGDVLNQTDLNKLLRNISPRIVSLVGNQDSGKTTLLASLYAQFCRNDCKGFEFCGSKSLLGFTKIHYLALLSSGLLLPDTPRTPRIKRADYYHLALSKNGEGPRNLVISDRSGEEYDAARRDTSLITDLSELGQAERIAFLLDGPKITSPETRSTYSREFKQMIRALRDNGALDHKPVIEILSTKLDELEVDANGDDLKKRLAEFESRLVSDFKNPQQNIDCYRICSLPKAKPDIGVYGIGEILDRWTAAPSLPLSPEKMSGGSVRELDRLVGRWETDGAL